MKIRKKLTGYKVIHNGKELIPEEDYYVKNNKFIFKRQPIKYNGTPYPKGQIVFIQEMWWE